MAYRACFCCRTADSLHHLHILSRRNVRGRYKKELKNLILRNLRRGKAISTQCDMILEA